MNAYRCGAQTPRMKGPCEKWMGHVNSLDAQTWAHSSRSPENDDTPRLRQFAQIVHEGLDRGVTYSYVEIAERMGGVSLHTVRSYGLGARYTRLRQKIYRERGIAGNKRRLTPQQAIVRELRMKGEF